MPRADRSSLEEPLTDVVADAPSGPGWPPSFVCPITQEPMHDPVIAMDGVSYEFSVIREWFREHSISPVTNVRLPSKLLIRNIALRNAMHEWNEIAELPPMPQRADPEQPPGAAAGGDGSGGSVLRTAIAFESADDWNTLATSRRPPTACARNALQWCSVRPWFFVMLGFFGFSAAWTFIDMGPFPGGPAQGPQGPGPGHDPPGPPGPGPPGPGPGPPGGCPPWDPLDGPGGPPEGFWQEPKLEQQKGGASLEAQIFASWTHWHFHASHGETGDFSFDDVVFRTPPPGTTPPPNSSNSSGVVKFGQAKWHQSQSRLLLYDKRHGKVQEEYRIEVSLVPVAPDADSETDSAPQRRGDGQMQDDLLESS